MSKVLQGDPSIPGGNPDRPVRMRRGPICTSVGCERNSFREGLCVPCHDDHLAEMNQEPSEDQWNEAFSKARNS